MRAQWIPYLLTQREINLFLERISIISVVLKAYDVHQRYQYRVIITKHMRMFYFRLLKDISIRLRNKNSWINITIRSMNFTMSPYENSAGNMKLTLTTSRESLFDSYFFFTRYMRVLYYRSIYSLHFIDRDCFIRKLTKVSHSFPRYHSLKHG